MSGSRVRRGSPMKATLPLVSLTRQNSGLETTQTLHQSPANSPSSPWRCRISPDQNLSRIRSPGAVIYKSKCKTPNETCSATIIRRTASLDMIYLTGQWPRESLYMYTSNLQVDRSTQTDDWLGEGKKYKADTPTEEKIEKLLRHRRPTKENSKEKLPVFTGAGFFSGSEHSQHRHKMRSSIEGLNQEIERLVLKASNFSQPFGDREEKRGQESPTPEGHRAPAPVADMLRQTRSVNTQTPAAPQCSPDTALSESSVLLSNPIGSCDSYVGSADSSPENEGKPFGSSPRINKFLAREPPDGCERVSLKFTEESRKAMVDISEMNYPLKPSTNFQLRPSLGSAFHSPRSITTPEPASQ